MSNKKQAMDVEKQAKPKRGREDEEEEEDEEEMEQGVSKVDLAKEHLKDLPQSVRRRVFALTNLQKRHAELDRQYRDELDALERKYLALHAPLLDRRTAIVTGESEPAEEEAAGYVVDGTAPATEARGVPMFWYHTLVNNDTVNQLTGLNERDKDAIAALQDIRYTPLPRTRDTVDGKEIIRHGFTLAFKFGPNEFFEDSLLTKTYHLTEDDSGEPLFERSEATKPQWKAGKNLTVRVIKKAVPRPKRGGKGGRGAHSGPQFQTVEEPCESFFQFFSPVQMPAEDTEVDPEEFEETTQAVQADFEAGCELRDVVCPRAVAWFTGDAVEEDDEDDFDEEDYDEEDDGEGEDDEDDEEDEDEDEEEEAKPRKGAKPQSHQFAPPPGGKPAGENPECKQQ